MQLADLFSVDAEPAEICPESWDTIVRDASLELLLPALYQRVNTLGISATLSPVLTQLLVTTEALNGERNRLFVNEAVYAAKLLNGIGIRPVALKGLAYLFAGVHLNPASRYLLDIDFLIPEWCVNQATALLHQHGFIDDESDVIAPLRHHGPSLSRRNSPPIELHHRIALGVCNRLLPAAEVFAEATHFEYDGAHFLIPSATHLANHLILHSQLHNAYRYRVFPPLRALFDLLLLTQTRSVDWKALVTRYKKQGEYLTLALHFKAAQQLLGLQPPVSLPLGVSGNLRWARRQVITRLPWLRFFDPVHLLMGTFRNRLRIIPRLMEHPEYSLHFAKAFTEKKYYRDLLGF